jgi:hypothetical protein
MGKGTKEMLHKILDNQKLIMDHLKIKMPASSITVVTKVAPTKTLPAKKAAVKKVQRKKQ